MLPVLRQNRVKPGFEEALLSVLCSKDVREEREREKETGSRQGDNIKNFLILPSLTCTMMGLMETEKKRAESEIFFWSF